METIKEQLIFLWFFYGKTIIWFTSHGCQATIHEFEYVGTIIGFKYISGVLFYTVKVLKSNNGNSNIRNVHHSFIYKRNSRVFIIVD